jgi:hypothetical protein
MHVGAHANSPPTQISFQQSSEIDQQQGQEEEI